MGILCRSYHSEDGIMTADITIQDVFKFYKGLQAIMEDEIKEISVHQDQISICCHNFVEYGNFGALSELLGMDPTDISIFNDSIYISYRIISSQKHYSTYVKTCKDIMSSIADCICQCPSLEMTVTDQYAKVYLDKPNIKVKDISELDTVMGAEGTLQTGEQRAYVLYLNE